MAGLICSRLTDAILDAIVDGIDIFTYGNRRPMQLLTCGLEGYRAIEAERARARIRSQLSRMQRQGLIRPSRGATYFVFRLTQSGQQRSDKMGTKPSALRVGQHCIVSYDIPERYKGRRQAFRRYLAAKGFQHIHRSVWASDHDWTHVLHREIRSRHIENWVKLYITTRPISPD